MEPGTGEGIDGAGSTSIRVVVRCRPFNHKELAEGGAAVSPVECGPQTIVIPSSSQVSGAKSFSYDHVFGSDASQAQVYDAVGVRLLKNALDAYNGCIFAYGQTGAGKSHSVVGDAHSEEHQGILPRACTQLFDMIAARAQSDSGFQATVLASYLEIYNEKLFDLLASGRESRGELHVRTHPTLGSFVASLTESPITSFVDALELLDFGAKRRAVGATQMNATSSRSHAIFTVQIRMAIARAGTAVDSQAKLHFVDLAGSERQKKTGAEGDRLKEGIGINQSLSTLGRVISDLTKPGGPGKAPAFRDSKLTLLLKDALMGNSRTELLACVSPAASNLEETIGTLEFASRCKLVKTSARKNEHSKVDLIAKLTSEKAQMEAMLQEERLRSEELMKQLSAQQEKDADWQKAAESAVAERKRIEEHLRELECSNGAREAGISAALSTRSAAAAASSKAASGPADTGAGGPAVAGASVETGSSPASSSSAEGAAAGGGGGRASKAGAAGRLPAVGDRIFVHERCTGGRGRLAATVRFVGETDFSPGAWVGVELEGPFGKNSGSVNGRSYFEVEEQHGLFVRPDAVVTTAASPAEYLPGEYRLVARVLVTESVSSTSAQVGELRKGMYVRVLEVGRVAAEKLVRGRIEDPAGWISIASEQDRHQHWAVRDTADDAAEGGAGGGGGGEAEVKERRKEVNEFHRRLAAMEAEEQRLQKERRDEQELRSRLERERQKQLEREQDLVAQIDALRGVKESFALDQAQIEEKRQQQHRQREAELSKLGMHLMDIELEDMPNAPKLVNLHPDPALKGCLVYCLPEGETRIGSDSERCRVALSGLNMGAEMCAVVNEGNEQLHLRPLCGGVTRVNGRVVGPEGAALEDGDRLAISRAYIFQVQIPLSGALQGDSDAAARRRATESDDFDKALEEIAEQTEVDPTFQNGIEKAMMLVKCDFGSEAAGQLLAQARRASEACIMGNGVLRQMPASWRNGVERFELSILFDAHGLPEVCVVARRAPPRASAASSEEEGGPSGSPRGCGAGAVSGDFRSGATSAGIWEIEQFWQERLPAMFEALSDSGLGGSMLYDGGCTEEASLERWESRVWAEVSVEEYRSLCVQQAELREQLREAKRRLKALEERGASSSPSGGGGGVLGNVGGWVAKKAADTVRPLRAASGTRIGSSSAASTPGSPRGERGHDRCERERGGRFGGGSAALLFGGSGGALAGSGSGRSRGSLEKERLFG